MSTHPVASGDPWAELTRDKIRYLPRPTGGWPPKKPGPIVGDRVSDRQQRAIWAWENWRDRDLPKDAA